MLLPLKDYPLQDQAEALLFRSPKTYERALRIASRHPAREFVDNAYIGTDPSGTLYYDDIRDLSGGCSYKVQRVTDSRGSVYARIQFYKISVSSPFAEFLGRDPTEAVNAAQMDEYTCNGHWQELNDTVTRATITRASGANTITLVLDPEHKNFHDFKKATIPLTSDLTLSLNSISGAKGDFTFKEGHDLISEGLCANWTPDRIVFYKNDYLAKDWVGFFAPDEGANIGYPVPSKSTIPCVFTNVRWGPL